MEPEFRAFPSIPRLKREVVITEKIDGTNAVVHVSEDGQTVTAGSRNGWLTPDHDNYGFLSWVNEHKEQLMLLGPGYHYGEWWGAGIQRRYGLDHRRFSLFNVGRWGDLATRPTCCHVVPVLAVLDKLDSLAIDGVLGALDQYGSRAAPGFMKPEGIVVYHVAAGKYFKYTFDGDGRKFGVSAGEAA